MHITTNFQGKIEGRKEAVFTLKIVCTGNVPGLCTFNQLSYEISLSCRAFRQHDRDVIPCLDLAILSLGAYLWPFELGQSDSDFENKFRFVRQFSSS
jgi:hypothetical protein